MTRLYILIDSVFEYSAFLSVLSRVHKVEPTFWHKPCSDRLYFLKNGFVQAKNKDCFLYEKFLEKKE